MYLEDVFSNLCLLVIQVQQAGAWENYLDLAYCQHNVGSIMLVFICLQSLFFTIDSGIFYTERISKSK